MMPRAGDSGGKRSTSAKVPVPTLALGALLLWLSFVGAGLHLSGTVPIYNTVPDSCWVEDSTSIDSSFVYVDVFGVRFRAPQDTIFFGKVYRGYPGSGGDWIPWGGPYVPRVGGDTIHIDTDINAALAPMGVILVYSVDVDGTRSCHPASYLYAIPDTTGNVDWLKPPPPGPGLVGSYYRGRDFDTLAVVRVDPEVNFVWYQAAWKDGPVDSFSVRWDGTLTVPIAGAYNLYQTSDDGRRVRLDAASIMDFWVPTWSEGSWSGYLAAGPHQISIDIFENTGAARAILYWSGPGFDKQVVPASVLSH
jgi:hypothetical protein